MQDGTSPLPVILTGYPGTVVSSPDPQRSGSRLGLRWECHTRPPPHAQTPLPRRVSSRGNGFASPPAVVPLAGQYRASSTYLRPPERTSRFPPAKEYAACGLLKTPPLSSASSSASPANVARLGEPRGAPLYDEHRKPPQSCDGTAAVRYGLHGPTGGRQGGNDQPNAKRD